MTVKDVMQKLQALPPDLEVVMVINESPGFADADHIEMYPIEHIFEEDLNKEHNPPYTGYYEDFDNKNKVMLYVYP